MKQFPDYTENIDELSMKQRERVTTEIGKTYNCLTITSFAFRNRNELYFNCRCVCGKEKSIKHLYLKNGHTVSCGCQRGKVELGENERDDLTGMTFGLWTVLSRDLSKTNRPFYLCRCACGTERSIDKYTLKKGLSWHCGCQAEKVRVAAAQKYRKKYAEGAYDRAPTNLIGQRFGRLTVVELLTEKRSGVEAKYRCVCDCGNETVKTYPALMGGALSCGCLKIETRDDITGQKFGRLTALEPIARPGKRLVWKCRCDCGKEMEVMPQYLKNGSTQSCGCLGREKGKTIIKAALANSGIVDGTSLPMVRGALEGKIRADNTSGARGVDLMKGRYYASITFKGKKYSLGGYGTLEEAAAVRKQAEQIIYGEWLEHFESDLKEDYEAEVAEKRIAALKELQEANRKEPSRAPKKRKERIEGYKEAVAGMTRDEEEDYLWTTLRMMSGPNYQTSRGVKFKFRIKGGEMFVDRKEKSITKSTVMRAYWTGKKVQDEEGCVSGPKKLGVPGAASYLYPIFQHLGVIQVTTTAASAPSTSDHAVDED